MNTFLFASVENLWLVAGWTMIHFLWLGTLVALAALLCRWLLRRASANVRYATSLACLALLAGLPVAIATWLHQNPPPSEVKYSLRRGEDRGGFVSVTAPGPIANLTSAPNVDLAKQEPISTNATPATPAQITTHAEVVRPSAPTASPALSAERDALSLAVSAISTAVHYLPWLWLIGTPITFALTATGLIGTRRLRLSSRPITDGLIHETLKKLAASLRLTRHVAVAVCDRIAAPVLIGILRPIILLPPAALTGYSPDEIEMVLLHELAHVRRWDNLVNLIQRLVESLLFFHPAVWLISSWVRREREACCDALVVTRTDRPHAYAELLVALAAEMPRSVLFHPAASSAMAAGPLRSRIHRILKLDDDPMLVSGKSIAVLLASLLATATIVGLYLPTNGHAEPSKPESHQNDDATESPAAEFSHQVNFEKGAAKFLDGDSISIDEIRGTAETFTPGNRYWIKGTYKLKSHDRAQISAFATAAKAEDGTGPIQSEQTKQIKGGEAAFTLILPMSVRGWPHLSFYPADNGGDFGGIYFGTGDSVLRKWWGEAAESTNESSKSTLSDADRERFHRFEKAIKDVEIVVALFNDKDGFFPALDETHKQLAQHERSLYTYGLKADPSSAEAKRFNLTSAPTCIVFRSGKEVLRLTPVESAKRLQEFVTIAVNGGATDVAQLLPLFQLKEGERAREKIYRLPATLEKVFPELPELIERLKKDPSRSQFAYNLKDSGRVVEVFAPDAAHQQFFGPRISLWEKNSKSDSNAEKQTTDNLKNLSLALQNFHTTRKLLPANAIYDANNKPLLSWRVQILPFLDEAKLYKEFQLNEPWDSEHNRKLIARMPDVFKNPKFDKPGMTNYLAVVGPECVFNGSPKALGFKHVTDGTAHTIALVEANADLATEWTKPQDWNFDRAQPTKGLGQVWPGGWYAALVDGSVRRVENSEPADQIGIQFTRAGGESKSLSESANRSVPEGVGPEAAPGEAAGAFPAAASGSAPGEAADAAPQAAVIESHALAKIGSFDAETELLLREIIDIQKKKRELEGQLYQAQTDYLVKKSQLDDPQLGESQKRTLEKQQLDKEFKIRFVALQQQLANTLKSLEERMKVLKGRNEKSVVLQIRDTTSARVLPSTENAQSPSLEKQKPDEDWLAGVVFASPKDAAISKRAWREWRIKIASATPDEHRQVGDSDSSLKVIGTGEEPTKSTMFLSTINGVNTRNFAELATALSVLKGRKVVVASCYRNTAQGMTYTDIALDGTDKPAIDDSPYWSLASTSSSHANGSAKFPSLDDQKLADLVWKRLKLEMAPIGQVELKRVKAFGYDGGMRLTDVDRANKDSVVQGQFADGDILVGLHVWPTRNMKDVAEVLNRSDLAELSPLKFYVVRSESHSTIADSQEQVQEDVLQTGRITVNLGGNGFAGGRPASAQADQSKTSAAHIFTDSPQLQAAADKVGFSPNATRDAGNAVNTALAAKRAAAEKMKTAKNDADKEAARRELEKADKDSKEGLRRLTEADAAQRALIAELDRKSEQNSKTVSPPAANNLISQSIKDLLDSPHTAKTEPVGSLPSATVAVPHVETGTSENKSSVVTPLPNTVTVANAEQVKVADHYVAQSAPTSVPAPVVPNQIADGRRGVTLTPAESVFIAYDIPRDLKDKVQQYFGRTSVRSMADDRGRYIVQAGQNWHDQFAALLKATPKWRDPAAEKERAAAPVAMKKVDGGDNLEWRSVGITLKPNRDNRLPLKAQTGVVVTEVALGSPAAWADMQLGDVLTDVGNFNAGTISEVQSLLKALGEGLQSKKTVSVTFYRPSQKSYIRADFTLGPEDLGAKPAEPQTSKASTELRKPNVIYEGKSFETWRSAWQSELSTEKRIEAVKAIATFGANGYGPEAAGSILDVAGQYDWVATVRADGATCYEPEGKLQRAVFGVLIGAPGAVSVEPKYWLPILRKRYEADPAKWQNVASLLLAELSSKSDMRTDDVRSMLLMLAQSKNEHIASRAYDALVRRYPDNEELTKLLCKMFQDKTHWISAVRWLGWTQQYPPEIVELFLHGTPKQQADVRDTFNDIPATPAKKALVAIMIAVLKDDAKSADHIAAIRALGALGASGSFGQSEAPQLLEEIAKKAPLEKQVAAAFALQDSKKDNGQAFTLLEKYGRDADGKRLDQAKIQMLFDAEFAAFKGK